MILITGGAGFIGSCLQAALAARGIPTVVSDWLGNGDKWRNLARHPPERIVPPEALGGFLAGAVQLQAVVHLGAISETTARDGDLAWQTQCRAVAPALGLVHRAAGAVPVCLVGGDLRCGVRGGCLRRRPGPARPACAR